MRVYPVDSNTVEVVPVIITTPADPTAGTVSFAFVAPGTEPSTFTAGSWSGSYDAVTDEAVALTPTCGSASATINLTSRTKWDLYARWVVGSETPTAQVGVVVVQ